MYVRNRCFVTIPLAHFNCIECERFSIAVEWNVEVLIEIVRFIVNDCLIEKACIINMKLFLKAAATFNFVLREWQNMVLQFNFDSWSNIIDKHRQIIMSDSYNIQNLHKMTKTFIGIYPSSTLQNIVRNKRFNETDVWGRPLTKLNGVSLLELIPLRCVHTSQ